MERNQEPTTITMLDTPILRVGCEISGPSGGAPVVLLHGWPDSVRTWDRVLAPLHAAGFRTFVPHLRGYGPTRFRDDAAQRSGQLAALGADLLEVADALGLQRFAVVGHDWGARAAYIASCLAPERISHCVALSVGWGTNDPDQTLSLPQIQNYWYHWYMSTDRGAALVREDRVALTRYIWTIWNPHWQFTAEEFDATARHFDNPDWADVVVHRYRVRWGLATGDPRYEASEARLRAAPQIDVPTLVIHGGADPVNAPATSEGKEPYFLRRYERVVLDRVGHFPQREAADAVAARTIAFLSK